MRAFLALACLTAASGFRQRRKTRGNSTGPVALSGADCDQLAGIVVGGRDLGQPAVLLCRFWPSTFGDFPIDNAKTIVNLFNGAGDLWKKIQELAKGREGNSPFCWKRMGMRERLSEIHLDGQLNMNASEVALSSNCDMESFGKCYGPCPRGMKSATLVGGFAPVCTSACIQSSHKTPCGFGCATGVGSCIQQVTDQVTVVARTVGQIGSFMSGNPAISEVVDKVLRLVEFAVDVVFDVVKVAKHVFQEWPREQLELGIIIALVQFVMEHAKTIGEDLLELKGMFGETIEMILELVDAEFDWKEINLKFISDTILKHGQSILGAANEFAQAFVFPKCQVTSDTNPDYDCDSDGGKDCGDWEYTKFRCNENGGRCEYRYKFGDVLLDQSCRCKK